MNTVFKNGIIPKHIQTDQGKEFYNKDFAKLMEKHNINHYSTYSVKKASVVERFNRTIKSLMWKEFSFKGSYNWIDILNNLLLQYNNTKHRTIKMKPVDVNEKNEKQLLHDVYNRTKVLSTAKYQIGDKVRISKYKALFDKGYYPSWSTEIFTIRQKQNTSPVTYLLEDENGQPIAGGFYEHEIQRTMYPDVYLIEKILRKNKNRYFVKWLGFDNKFNSYINKKDLV